MSYSSGKRVLVEDRGTGLIRAAMFLQNPAPLITVEVHEPTTGRSWMNWALCLETLELGEKESLWEKLGNCQETLCLVN